MLFKFQWHIEKHPLELDLGPGLIFISPESNIIVINHVDSYLIWVNKGRIIICDEIQNEVF